MEFTEALKQIEIKVAKALGGTTVKMTAEQFVAYADEQVKAAAGEDGVQKAERLAALKDAIGKAQAAPTGATEFEVETYKAKDAPAATEQPNGLEKAIDALSAKLDAKFEALVKTAKPAETIVADVLIDGDAPAPAAATPTAKSLIVPKDAPVAEPVIEEVAPLAKAKKETVEWPQDLSAAFHASERASAAK